MPKKDRNNPAATPRATTSVVQRVEPTFLPYQESYKNELTLIHRFLGGEAGVQKEMTAALAAAYQDKAKGPQINHEVGKAIVIHHLPTDIFVRVLAGLPGDPGKFNKEVTDQLLQCALEANLDPPLHDWSAGEKNRAVTAWLAKNQSAIGAGAGTINFLGAVTSRPGPRHPFVALEKKWANRAPRVSKEQETERLNDKRALLDLELRIDGLEAQKSTAVTAEDYDTAKELSGEIATLRQELANLNEASITTDVEEVNDEPVEVVPTFEEQIAALEAQKSTAVTAEDYDTAKKLSGEIATLRQELANTTTVEEVVSTPATTPTPESTSATVSATTAPSGVNGGTEFTLDDAIDCCTAEDASPDLKLIIERRKPGAKKPLGDKEFLRKVAVLTGNANNIAKSATA